MDEISSLLKKGGNLKRDELQKAFAEFSKVTETLQASYEQLKKEAHLLNIELEKKNKSLADSLLEQQSLRKFLEKVILNIPGGVAVIDTNKQPLVWNENFTTIAEKCGIDNLFSLTKGQSGTIEIEDAGITLRYSISPRYKITPLYQNCRVVFLEDISHLTEMEEKLKRREHLANMGEMAASIAHEIRNPLGGIKLFSSMLDAELKENEEQHTMTQHILRGVNNIEGIISNMLFFAKEPAPIKKPVALVPLIQEIITFFAASALSSQVHFVTPADKDIIVSGDVVLLRQLFQNLLLNAIQASEKEQPVNIVCEKKRKNKIEVKISDQGCGMTKTVLSKIFNPFYTQKERGTGLGMTIVHTIVNAHGGDISLKSAPKKGTVVTILFPIYKDKA